MASIRERVDFLGSVSLLSQIADQDLSAIARLMEEVDVSPGTPIIRKGEIGDCMYIIESGRVLVHIGDYQLAIMSPRDFFGEMAILDDQPRSAHVTAISRTRLLRLSQEHLLSAMSRNESITRGILRVLSQRVRTLNETATALNEVVQRKFKEEIRRVLEENGPRDDDDPVISQIRESYRLSEEDARQLLTEVRDQMRNSR